MEVSYTLTADDLRAYLEWSADQPSAEALLGRHAVGGGEDLLTAFRLRHSLSGHRSPPEPSSLHTGGETRIGDARRLSGARVDGATAPV